tara:strand:+ start:1816 stop:2313 length:498 start_codon:yes stop_codon:yes gene_type:complete
MRLTKDIIRGLIKEALNSQERKDKISSILNQLANLDDADVNYIMSQVRNEMDKLEEAHDHEGDMAKRQMYKTARDAAQVFDMIQPGDNYPAWLQSKMTKVADYMGVIKNYLEYDHVVGEKLDKDADAGDYVKDFQKSDAPQFKGKSKKKKQKMAIAAYLDAQDDK